MTKKKKLTGKEATRVRLLANGLMLNDVSYETAATIVGMRLSYLGKFSIPNLEIAFRDWLEP